MMTTRKSTTVARVTLEIRNFVHENFLNVNDH